MRQFTCSFLVLSVFFVAQVFAQSDPPKPPEANGQAVPILGDLPVIGNFFTASHRRSLDFAFNGNALTSKLDGAVGENGTSEFRDGRVQTSLLTIEQWVTEALPKVAPGVTEIGFEEVATRRYDAFRSGAPESKRFLLFQGNSRVCQRVDDYFVSLARQRDRMITVVTTILERDCLSREDAPTEAKCDLMDLVALRKLKEEFQRTEPKKGSYSVLTAPSVSAWSGQCWNVRVGRDVLYLKDYEIHEDSIVFADPIYDKVWNGIALDGITMIGADGETLTFDGSFRVARVMEPIETHTTKVGPKGQEVTIELPELHMTTWAPGPLTLDASQRGLRIRGVKSVEPDHYKEWQVLIEFILSPLVETPSYVVKISAGEDVVVEASSVEAAQSIRPGTMMWGLRGKAMTGRVRVDRVEGRLLLTKRVGDGELEIGDTMSLE